MPDFLTDEWFVAVLDAAADLPEVPGVDFDFDLEVTESAHGKVRGHGSVESGRLISLAGGKRADAAVRPLVTFAAKAKRALPVVTGDVSPLVAFMRGELKIDGAYEVVIDDLVRLGDGEALAAFGNSVAAETDG